MKPYGMKRRDHRDVDAMGCVQNGRPTALYALPRHGGDASAPHSLRAGKRAAVRRAAKRAARAESSALCEME